MRIIVHRASARREAAAPEELRTFRAEVYSVFGNWADALFELVDALAGTARPIRSVAELMFPGLPPRLGQPVPGAGGW